MARNKEYNWETFQWLMETIECIKHSKSLPFKQSSLVTHLNAKLKKSMGEGTFSTAIQRENWPKTWERGTITKEIFDCIIDYLDEEKLIGHNTIKSVISNCDDHYYFSKAAWVKTTLSTENDLRNSLSGFFKVYRPSTISPDVGITVSVAKFWADGEVLKGAEFKEYYSGQQKRTQRHESYCLRRSRTILCDEIDCNTKLPRHSLLQEQYNEDGQICRMEGSTTGVTGLSIYSTRTCMERFHMPNIEDIEGETTEDAIHAMHERIKNYDLAQLRKETGIYDCDLLRQFYDNTQRETQKIKNIDDIKNSTKRRSEFIIPHDIFQKIDPKQKGNLTMY